MSHQIWFLTESILLENPGKTFTVPHMPPNSRETQGGIFSTEKDFKAWGRFESFRFLGYPKLLNRNTLLIAS